MVTPESLGERDGVRYIFRQSTVAIPCCGLSRTEEDFQIRVRSNRVTRRQSLGIGRKSTFDAL